MSPDIHCYRFVVIVSDADTKKEVVPRYLVSSIMYSDDLDDITLTCFEAPPSLAGAGHEPILCKKDDLCNIEVKSFDDHGKEISAFTVSLLRCVRRATTCDYSKSIRKIELDFKKD